MLVLLLKARKDKDVRKNNMSKYNLQDIFEGMSDKEFADAQEKDRLEKHPERDKIKAIQALLAKEKSMKEDLFSKDGGNEDNVDNIDKVASPDAKASDYSSAISSNRSEDSAEQAGTTKTTKPMYNENKSMSLMDLAKKLGIDVDELKDKVEKFKGKEKDEIEAGARASMAEENTEDKLPMDEARVDRDVAERIEGMLSIPLKRKFLDSFMDLWQDLIEEDPFYAEDVINHLNNEMHKEIDGYQAAGDRLAGIGENHAMQGVEAELESGEIGNMDALAEDDSAKDLLDKIRKYLKGSDRNFQDNEIEMYIDSLKRDIKRGEFDGVESYSMEDHEEDLINYIDDKALQEHFGRFLKDYQ